jgi:Fe-S-cluster containining protein
MKMNNVMETKMNSVLYNIPAHAGCKNCGECCGIIPASLEEVRRIKEYLSSKPDIRRKALARLSADRSTCPFRGQCRCDIYPARPLLCRLFGVTSGMQCIYGNSAEIDGQVFLAGRDTSDCKILNDISLWE